MANIYLVEKKEYDENTFNAKVVSAFASIGAAEAEVSRLDAESLAWWIKYNPSDPDDRYKLRTTYSVKTMELGD